MPGADPGAQEPSKDSGRRSSSGGVKIRQFVDQRRHVEQIQARDALHLPPDPMRPTVSTAVGRATVEKEMIDPSVHLHRPEDLWNREVETDTRPIAQRDPVLSLDGNPPFSQRLGQHHLGMALQRTACDSRCQGGHVLHRTPPARMHERLADPPEGGQRASPFGQDLLHH